MRRHVLGFVALLVAAAPPTCAAGTRMLLVARGLDDRPLSGLAVLLRTTNRLAEAEPVMRRALAIDEKTYGPGHPQVARDLNDLVALLQATDRLAEAEPLLRRCLVILLHFSRRTGHEHPHQRATLGSYRQLLGAMGKSQAEIEGTIEALGFIHDTAPV